MGESAYWITLWMSLEQWFCMERGCWVLRSGVIWAVGSVCKRFRLQWGKGTVGTGQCCWPLEGKVRDAAKRLTTDRAAPTIKYYMVQNVSSVLGLRNPALEISFPCIFNNSASKLDGVIKATWPNLGSQGKFFLKGWHHDYILLREYAIEPPSTNLCLI